MSRYYDPETITWFATTKDGIGELAKNTELKLTSSDFRVLFYVLSEIDNENRATLPTQTAISKEINISVRKISEAFRRLRDAKILVKSGEARTYFINPAFFYACGRRNVGLVQDDFDSHFSPASTTDTPNDVHHTDRIIQKTTDSIPNSASAFLTEPEQL